MVSQAADLRLLWRDRTPVTEEKFVAPHDVRDIVEGRGVEFHDTVPSDRLVDLLVQGLGFSPELHQIAVARACVRLHARRRSEDVTGRFKELDINWERAIRNRQSQSEAKRG